MKGSTLLVLCGDPMRRKDFVKGLSEAGWRGVLAAPSTAEAVRLLRDATGGCAVVDEHLEDIPGLKAVPILRSLCDELRIVFAAPKNSREMEAQVRALDVFYYHVGPADSEELTVAVRDAIGAPSLARTAGAAKVLIVDDDLDFQQTMGTILRSAGYSVVSARSQREGLEAARREAPDVILLDIIMNTTTDGFEFCREARRDPLIKHTPLLGVSAIDTLLGTPARPDSEPGLFPVDGYLSKPVAPKALLAELERLVARPVRPSGRAEGECPSAAQRPAGSAEV